MTDNAELVRRLRGNADYLATVRSERYATIVMLRKAAAALEELEALPLKERPDFIAGYDAGLYDAKLEAVNEIEAMRKERDEHERMRNVYVTSAQEEHVRAEAAESALAEANRKLGVAREALVAIARERDTDAVGDRWLTRGASMAQTALSQITNAEGSPERSRPGEAG